MLVTQLNRGATSLTNLNKVSLHTGDPGNTGLNDSGRTKQTIVWTTPSKGYIRGLVTFADVPAGTYTHVGLWDNTTFVYGRPFNVTIPSTQDLIVLVEFTVDVAS